MTWLNQYARGWRIIILILLVLTFIGPWGYYDRIYVPAQYECRPPFNYRLEGNFCGILLPGTWAVLVGFGHIFSMFAGEANVSFPLLLMRFLMGLSALITPLPIFSSLFLLSSEQFWPQVRHLKVWGFSVIGGVGMFLWFELLSGWLSFHLWGAWAYLVLAVAALLLEIAVWRGNRRSDLGVVAVG